MYMTEISAKDMIFYKEGDNIMSGGFSIDSILLHKGLSPMQTKNNGGALSGGDSVSSIFKNLAVPAGLLYQPTHEKKRSFLSMMNMNMKEDLIQTMILYCPKIFIHYY